MYVYMILDDREHGLIALLPHATALPLEVKHLPVADIWIGTDKPNGLMIERKSVSDFEASIIDGRYREQRSRLMTYATEQKAHVVYVIEGELDRLGKRTLTKQALMKHITRLALRYHIAVFQTASINETAELCSTLEDQIATDPTTFEQPATMTYIETRGKTREENSDDPKVFLATVLQACRGVSAAGAQAITAVYPSLESLMQATVEGLAVIQVGKMKFGQVKALRLHSLLHSQ